MIKTIKLRIYPNKKQQEKLIKMATGVDLAWNYLNKIQSERMKKLYPVIEKVKVVSKTDKKTGKVTETEERKVYYDRSKKAPIEVPYKAGKGEIRALDGEGGLIRWEIFTHFLGQYTEFGKMLSDKYDVMSGTNIQICEQLSINAKQLVKDAFENYVSYGFLLKERTKADWVPFNNNMLKATARRRVSLFGLDIRTSSDRRSLKELAENSDIRHMSVSDITKALKSGSITRDGFNKWFLNVAMDLVPKREPVKRVEGVIGIDPGLNTCMTTSDGDKFERPDVSEIRAKIDSLKSKASKSKGGKARVLTKKDEETNRQVNVFYRPSKHILKKAKRLEERLTNKKRVWEWQVANAIVSKGKDIAIGDVSIGFLGKKYGKSVNREAIFTLWSAIESKAKDNGILSTRVNERDTTVTCSSCGEKTGPSGREGLKVRSWICSNCGAEHDRDINAAKNIAKIGQINIEIDKEKKAKEAVKEEVESFVNKKNSVYAATKKIMNLKDKSIGDGKTEFSVEVFVKGKHSKERGEKIGNFKAIWDGKVSSVEEVF